ncbi:trichohyalin-like isoform X1 [Schistocerca gregaria]|uniref:trichohyalin-like isoform X1 n=1 Tax=Schistocerca gregaria TaxID=7010 RepID=UPI00211DDEBF|nr:trichohyalin-like isoform X1 [Schistocerca gregaria]
MEAKSHLLLLLVSVAAAMPAPATKNDNRRGRSEANKSDVDFVVVLVPTSPMEGKIDVAELLKKARDTMLLMRQSQQQKHEESQPQRHKLDQQSIKQTQQFEIQARESELPEIDPNDLQEGQKLMEMFEQSMAERPKHKEDMKLEVDKERKEDEKLKMRQSQQQKPQKSQPQRQKFDQQPIKQTQQFDIQAQETELPEIDPKDLEEGQKLVEMFEQSMAQRQKHKEVKKLEADNELKEDKKLQVRLSQQQKNDQLLREQSQREQHKHDQVSLIEPESPETETLEIEPEDHAEGKKVMELFEQSLAQRQKQKRLKKLKEEQPVLTRGYFTEVVPDSTELAGALNTDESQEAELKSGELLEDVLKMAEDSPQTMVQVAEESPQTAMQVAEESPQIAIQVAEESPQTVVQIAEESPQATTQVPEESPLTSMAPSIKKLKEEDWPEELFPCPPGEQRDADGNCDEIRSFREFKNLAVPPF